MNRRTPCQYCGSVDCAYTNGSFDEAKACDGLRAAWERDAEYEGYCDGIAARRGDHQADE